MSTLTRMICVLAALAGGVQVTGASAQQAKSVESSPAESARHLPADTPIAVEKECVGADSATVCWLRFTDGTRCVVANNAGEGDNSTALNCHFSTPMERLHRMPKE
jgi:hypothetical protein